MIPEITITVKYSKRVAKRDRITITNSEEVSHFLRNIFNQDTFDWREEMILICLSRANDIIGYYKVSAGGTTGTICDPKMVFTTALNCTANGIILAHNHPSGSIKPSDADKAITDKIKRGAELLDMKLLDHLIITDDNYYSFADEGLI